MCRSVKPYLAMLATGAVLLLTGCTAPRVPADNTDSAMMSHPSLYRGAQYHPHPQGLNLRQTELDLAPGIAYKGCVSVVTVSLEAADSGQGLDCGAPSRISLESGVRYGDCLVLRRVTVAEAANGSGLLCDDQAVAMRASLENLRLAGSWPTRR